MHEPNDANDRRRRVLIVEDDALARTMLADTFEANGYDAVAARDASSGFELLTDQLFSLDLLLTDVVMPGLDGEGFVNAIRHRGGERDLPIVVVTGARDLGELRDRLRARGANAVLSKSLGPKAIFDIAHGIVAPRS